MTSSFVRFHAAQSIGVSVVFIVAGVLLGILTSVLAVVPILGWLTGLALSLGFSLLGLAGTTGKAEDFLKRGGTAHVPASGEEQVAAPGNPRHPDGP